MHRLATACHVQPRYLQSNGSDTHMNTPAIPPELQQLWDQYKVYFIELKPDVLPDWQNIKGMIVRAHDEQQARQQAASYATHTKSGHEKWWLSDEFSTCNVLDHAGPPGVLLANFT